MKEATPLNSTRGILRSAYRSLPAALTTLLKPVLGPPSLEERDFVHRLKSSYETVATAYGEDYWSRKAASFGLAGADTVLDLGCGPGHWLVPLGAANRLVVGVDLADEMLRLSRERSTDGLSRLARCRAEALPFRQASFEKVLCYSVLLYTEPDVTLTEIARVLKPGGETTLGVPGFGYYLRHVVAGIRCGLPEVVRYGLDPILQYLLHRGSRGPAVITPWSRRRLRKLLARRGFVELHFWEDRKDPSWPLRYLGCSFYLCVRARSPKHEEVRRSSHALG